MPATKVTYTWLPVDDSQNPKITELSSGVLASLETLGWSEPDGYAFVEWNTESDGSGTSYSVGSVVSGLVELYTIWETSGPTYLSLSGLTTYDGLIKAEISGKIDVGGRTGGIPYGNVDSTSTSTVFTATVDGLTELYDGACVMLHNGVVTSAKGFTVNVNGLGAKKCYSNMTNATQETTVFNANYTLMFVYSTALDSGNGGWWIYRGYDANTTYTPVKLGFGYGHCTTAAATAAKAVAISGYVLNTGGIVSVLFDHDVRAGATLNVTSKGAKAIYYKGAAITNGVIKAGDTATFVYSTQYHLVSIDRWGSDIDGKQDALVSGTSIKTVNGSSLLGSGNISTAELPSVTSSDNGKVLRVVNGAWAAAQLPSASGVSF